jgi:hypothetical protein
MSEQVQTNSNDEISLKDLILKIKEWIAYLKTQWWKIAIAGIVGGIIGFVYAWIQPITYTAKTTFVVEDAKSGPSLGGLASLAGQFGVDVGGGGGGLIAGDNILLYFKSESLAREVLLSPFSESDKNTSLADVYVVNHGLKKSWAKNDKIGEVNFPSAESNQRLTRLQDSLIQVIIRDRILKKQFSIAKIDKKAGFIQLGVTMQNEKLAKIYCDRLVSVAVARYIDLKTERQKKTVEKLQARADSLAFLLSKKTSATASLQTAASTMDVNPLFKTGTIVATEQTNRDKSMLTAVYGEVVKNLELAKFTLSQETPVIQIVDKDNFPLKKKKESKLIDGVIFGFLFAFFFTFYIISKKILMGALS